MKNYFKKNRILMAIALIGLIASLFPVAARVQAEEANKKYDLILDYSSLRAMARQSELSEGEWLDLFASLGIDKVALGEASARDMQESAAIPVYAGSIKEIKENYGWDLAYPPEVVQWIRESGDLADALIAAETKEAYEWVLSALQERKDALVCRSLEQDGGGYIFIPQQTDGMKGEKVLDLCLGIWPETAELVLSHGMSVVPRTVTVDGMNGRTFAGSFVGVLREYESPYFINSGDSLLGYDDGEGEEILRTYLRESGTGVGMFEQNDQSQNLVWDGIEELLESTGYNGIRVFNEWDYIQFRYAYCGYEGPEEITNSLFRAIAERNCKVVYFKMILEPDNKVGADAEEEEWTYITDPADYEKLLTDLDTRLSALGYTNETVPAMELDNPSALVRMLEGFGVAALFVMLLDLLLCLSGKWRFGLLLAGTLGVLALAFLKPGSYPLLLSMAGGIVMPSLAGVGLCRVLAGKRRSEPQVGFVRLLGGCVGTGLLAVLVSLGGALLASSALSQLSYMIEIDLYRGVKIMQLIPIALFALAYLLVYAYEETGAKRAVLANIGERGEKGRARRFCGYLCDTLDRPMKLSWFVSVVVIAVACVFVLAAGVYYIYRTGNSMGVSAAELQLRNLLENLLVARPRTKEMLIGWPCLLLFIWSLRRHMNFLPLVFGLGMSIGLVSVVNTFLHIRTPFLLSLLRTGWGLLFGFAIGVIAVLVSELVYRLIKKNLFGSSHV